MINASPNHHVALIPAGEWDSVARALRVAGYAASEMSSGPAQPRRFVVARMSVACGDRACLTARETEVMVAYAAGKSNAEIARELFVSLDTVRSHCLNAYRKLGASGRAHAVALAYQAGILVTTVERAA